MKGNNKMRWIPDKDDKEGYSHVADCLQYVCLVVHGGMMPYVFQALRPPPTNVRRMPPGAWT